jgi:hypothetical protein
MHLSQPHRPRLRDEHGMSMFLVIIAMLITSMFVAAAYAAANGDLPISGGSKDRKASYAAAEAGLNFYSYHLNQDSDYWTKCDQVPAPNATEQNPVNQAWDGTGSDPRRWRNVPGSTAQYTVELLPATGYSKCIVGDQKSIVDLATGTFRMRFTGRPSPTSNLRRSIVSTFRRAGFLDFLYFTDFEDKDPMAYNTASERSAAVTACANKYRPARTSACDEIQFVTGDGVKGPMHTNDDILTCGTPIFGRTPADKVEISGSDPGWKLGSSGCGGPPEFKGTKRTKVEKLVMPTANNELRTAAQTGGLVYTGTTTVRLNADNTMDVTNGGVTQTGLALPANGVLYVRTNTTGGCSIANPPPVANYATEPPSCGNLYITGSYSGSLTFGADNDIIVGSHIDQTQRDLVKIDGTDGVVGLIANNFVRVYHRVNRSGGSCSNANAPASVRIDAAILSLQHSFIVDNYACGAPLGTLSVNGAIAQKYRGPVGTGSLAAIATGFLKNYEYDDRLRYRSPPFFLPPVDAAWAVLRRNEQVPAR